MLTYRSESHWMDMVDALRRDAFGVYNTFALEG
jgi:hypothetical protein